MGATWRLVWSPEGRTIAAGIPAKTQRVAKRKAPMPYRKYLGEIYAELENPNAYEAVITLRSPGFLLGGTREHVSSAFELEEHAAAFGQQSAEVNKNRPGYADADISYRIVPVYSKNPIRASEVL